MGRETWGNGWLRQTALQTPATHTHQSQYQAIRTILLTGFILLLSSTMTIAEARKVRDAIDDSTAGSNAGESPDVVPTSGPGPGPVKSPGGELLQTNTTIDNKCNTFNGKLACEVQTEAPRYTSTEVSSATNEPDDIVRLRLQSSVSAFIDHGTCVIPWQNKWQSQANIGAGGHFNASGDTDSLSGRGALILDSAYGMFCGTIDADAMHELSDRSDSNGSNEVRLSEFKAAASVKMGLSHRKLQGNNDWVNHYSIYGYGSYGQGKSLSKDYPSTGLLTRNESDARQYALGVGMQAQGVVCANYDVNFGYYIGKSRSEIEANSSSNTDRNSTNGVTMSAAINCPISNLPMYWNAKVRHDTDKDESVTNYGAGLGWNVTDKVSIEVDIEQIHIKDVTNRAITAKVNYKVFEQK